MECSEQHGSSIRKNRRHYLIYLLNLSFIVKQRKNQHRRDFSDANAEHKVNFQKNQQNKSGLFSILANRKWY